MRHLFFLLLLSLSSFAQETSFQVHGHRGFRGKYPENTILAFKEAVKAGVYAIELDVIISQDSQVVVSHEPWFNPKICSKPDGSVVKKSKKGNLYHLAYDSIKQYDCGKRQHPKFAEQITSPQYKPLLRDVIDSIDLFCKTNNLPLVHYNIEIKSRKITQGRYHPAPEVIVDLLLKELKLFNINERILVQSFDRRCLQEVHQKAPSIRTGLLVANLKSFKKNIKKLGFAPYVYNPNLKLIKKKTILQAHAKGVKVVVWTVNEQSAMDELRQMGVDGIITDYPNKAIKR